MVDQIKHIFKSEAIGGVLLVAAALLALVFANSPVNGWYDSFLNVPVVFQIGLFEINKPLLLWVNDGLMALFFFMVGLEIKREMMEGQLRDPKQLVLPAAGAFAGIAVPALIYVYFNADDAIAISGWAIPSATDIAFALGVFVIFGKHLPLSLKLFLLTVAIFDDIAAVIIIALFYSQDLSTVSIIIALVGLVGLSVLNYKDVQNRAAYILIGFVVWAAVLKSGVHATLAGFAVAWFIPLSKPDGKHESMLEEIEHGLDPWVTYMILPIFAFANAGVNLIGASSDALFNTITLGIAAGLFLGKQLGIFGACWLVIKLGWTKMPEKTTWLQLYGVSLLCGIGFTMSLFIGSLAFENQDATYQNSVKIGVLVGSLLSAILGALIISRKKAKDEVNTDNKQRSTSKEHLAPQS